MFQCFLILALEGEEAGCFFKGLDFKKNVCKKIYPYRLSNPHHSAVCRVDYLQGELVLKILHINSLGVGGEREKNL